MEFVAATYIGSFDEKQLIMNVYDRVNRYFQENDIPVRLLFIRRTEVGPAYLINLQTSEGTLKVYPLEAVVEALYSRLLQEMESNGDIVMNKIFALTTFPLVSRNPYFDFYEKFLGVHEVMTNLRMMVLSTKPFEVPISRHDSAEERRRKLAVVERRLFKGVLHELGHGFGLPHCPDNCVMHPPSRMEDWDATVPGYCADCLRKLRSAVQEEG